MEIKPEHEIFGSLVGEGSVTLFIKNSSLEKIVDKHKRIIRNFMPLPSARLFSRA